MPDEQLIFEFVDGSRELIRKGTWRYWELIEDGHTPVGSVPESDGISDALEAYLSARFTASAEEASAGLAGRVDAVESEVEGRLSESGLSATLDAKIGAPPRSPLAVTLGDSLAAWGSGGSSFLTKDGGDNWFPQLCAATDQRIQFGGTFSTGGYTIEQVRDTHLPQVLAMTPRPGFVFVICGHNSSKSTTGTFATAKAAYLQIIDGLLAAGIQPVIVLNMPHGDGVKWNLWLTDLGAVRRLPVVDAYSVMADPAATTTLASLSIDTIHPNGAGHRKIAEKALADGVLDLFPPRTFRGVKSSADTTDLLGGKGIFGTDINADGADDRWNFTVGTRQPSLVTPDAADRLAGKWQRIKRDSTNAGADMLMSLSSTNRINSGFAVGDVIEMSLRFRATGFEAGGKWWMARINRAGAAIPYAYMANRWKADATGTLVARFAVPDATTSLNLEVQIENPGASATLTLDVGEVVVRNLTALGALA